jgi:hypothetical protein
LTVISSGSLFALIRLLRVLAIPSLQWPLSSLNLGSGQLSELQAGKLQGGRLYHRFHQWTSSRRVLSRPQTSNAAIFLVIGYFSTRFDKLNDNWHCGNCADAKQCPTDGTPLICVEPIR